MVNANDIRLGDITACENAGRRLDKIAVRVAWFAPLVIALVTTGSVATEPAAKSDAPQATATNLSDSNSHDSNTRPPLVWLSDLPERAVKVGWGHFGKQGQMGFEPGVITTWAIACEHGLGAHPDSHIEYVLEKKYRTFRTTAAMNDTCQGVARPVEFRVLGDGKLLWQSFGMHNRRASQPCLLDITGVDVVALETRYQPNAPGDGSWAHAVWIDPYVSAEVPTAETSALFAPASFLHLEQAHDFDHRIRALLAKDDFTQLETIAKELRDKDVFYDAQSLRKQLYDVLGEPEGEGEQVWQQLLARLDRWDKAKPDSIVPLILRAEVWNNRAWLARGGGYANSVNSDGWKTFGEGLQQARKALEAAEKQKIKDPEICNLRIGIALGQDWSHAEAFAQLDKCIKLEPRFYPIYLNLANCLLPQWHGEPGELQRFAADMRKRLGGDLGDEVYFRVACVEADQLGDKFFSDSTFKYEDLVPGIRVMLRDSPENSYYFNQACHMACLAENRPLATRLLTRLDSATYWPTIWTGYGRIDYWRRVIDPGTYEGEDILTIVTQSGWVRGVAFLNDNKRLLSGGFVPQLDFWSLRSDKLIDRLPVEQPIRCLAVDAQASHVILGMGNDDSPDSEAVVYNLKGDNEPQILKGHTGSVVNVAISRDGSRYGTAGRDNAARIWKTTDLQKPLTLSHPEWVYDIAFSADGKTAATASYQGGVWLWNAETGAAIGEPLVKMNQGPWQCRVRFAPDGKTLISASVDGTIRRWDLATRAIKQIKPEGEYIRSLDVSSDGKWFAVGRDAGRVDVFSLKSMRLAHSYTGHHTYTNALEFSPDSQTLASGADDGTIKLWPIKKLTAPEDAPPPVVRQSSDGTVALKATAAKLNGDGIMYEADKDCIGYWAGKDWVEWTAQVDKPGKFSVVLTTACGKGSGGSEYFVAVGAEKLTGKVHETADWTVFTTEAIGTIEIAQPARIAVSVKPKSQPGPAVMNLRQVELRPEK